MASYTFVTDPQRIEEGQKLVEKYLSDVNQEKVKNIMKEQIDVVGGNEVVFDIVDKNLKQRLVEFSLLKETCDLYKWRRRFFDENLPVLKGSWFTNSLCKDTITFLITSKFQQVVEISCSNERPADGSHPRGLYFEVDFSDDQSRYDRFRIDNLEILYHADDTRVWKLYYLTTTFLPGSYLRYGDVVKIIFEQFSNSPRRLEELAMMKVKKETVLDNSLLSAPVCANDVYGFITVDQENVSDSLNKEGRELLAQLASVYKEIKETFV